MRASFLFCALFFLTNSAISQKSQSESSSRFALEMKLLYPEGIGIEEGKVSLTLQGHLNGKSKLVPTGVYQAFFCRLENQISKTSKLPLKLRLGEYSYAEKLEGKNGFTHFSLR